MVMVVMVEMVVSHVCTTAPLHHCTTPATALCRVTGGVPGTRSDSFSDLQIATGPSEMFIMDIAKYSIPVEA